MQNWTLFLSSMQLNMSSSISSNPRSRSPSKSSNTTHIKFWRVICFLWIKSYNRPSPSHISSFDGRKNLYLECQGRLESSTSSLSLLMKVDQLLQPTRCWQMLLTNDKSVVRRWIKEIDCNSVRGELAAPVLLMECKRVQRHLIDSTSVDPSLQFSARWTSHKLLSFQFHTWYQIRRRMEGRK